MPDPNLVRINGTPYSWNSCAHFYQGLPYKGIVGVDYEETREVKIVRGAQQDGRPLGITAGVYEIKGLNWRLLRESAAALMADLTVFGAGSFGDAEFNYTLQCFEPPSLSLPPSLPSLPTTTVITGCRITRVAEKAEVGTDELVTEIGASALYLVRFFGGALPLQLWSSIRSLLP